MPFIPPKTTPSSQFMLRVASTVWSQYRRCGVRRCRRACQCLGMTDRHGFLRCALRMDPEEMERMVEFLAKTVELATPAMVEQSLAQAKTDDERQAIAFRRNLFLYYHQELANAGLAKPLGPPFVEDDRVVSP